MVYTPDGKKHHLGDLSTFKKFYLEHGLAWNDRYRDFEKQKGIIKVD